MSMPNKVVCRRCEPCEGYGCRDLARGEPCLPMAIYHKIRIEDEKNGQSRKANRFTT